MIHYTLILWKYYLRTQIIDSHSSNNIFTFKNLYIEPCFIVSVWCSNYKMEWLRSQRKQLKIEYLANMHFHSSDFRVHVHCNLLQCHAWPSEREEDNTRTQNNSSINIMRIVVITWINHVLIQGFPRMQAKNTTIHYVTKRYIEGRRGIALGIMSLVNNDCAYSGLTQVVIEKGVTSNVS